MTIAFGFINRDDLSDLMHGRLGAVVNGWTIVAKELTGTWRWGTDHELIIKDEAGNHWAWGYQLGSGDSEHNPLECEGEQIQLSKVEPYQETVTRYRTVK